MTKHIAVFFAIVCMLATPAYSVTLRTTPVVNCPGDVFPNIKGAVSMGWQSVYGTCQNRPFVTPGLVCENVLVNQVCNTVAYGCM